MSTAKGEELLTLAEVAELLRVGEATVRREGRRGRIVLTRIGKQIRVTREALAAYVASRSAAK